jgi:plastocyanin
MTRLLFAYPRLALGLAAALVLGIGTATALQAPLVRSVNYIYEPERITVTRGTTVQFVNEDADIHTITAKNGSFDSGLMFQGGTWQYVFNNPGTYEYFCLPHPWMVGFVVVE